MSENTQVTSAKRMEWWREARFGMFIHWGLYALPAGVWQDQEMDFIGEWLMSYYRIPNQEYSKLAAQFNPVEFDADAWVRLARDAGMKYIVITAKHHDGFAMYGSQSDPYNIVDATPFGRDPIAELAQACQTHGVRLCFYYSHALDWHEPDAGGTEPKWHMQHWGICSWGNDWDFPDHAQKDYTRYLETKVKPQLRELLTNYGPVGLIWFDTPFTITRAQCEELAEWVHRFQPDCLINSRLGQGLGDYESQGDNKIPDGTLAHDWESPITLNDTWGYKSFDHNWKSTELLLRKLIDIASKDGNYLLNVGPTAAGIIPQPSVERLREVGDWLLVNGAAIYGTVGSPLGEPSWGRYTHKPGLLYAHIFDWPADGLLKVPLANRVSRARLLAEPETPLEVAQSRGEALLRLPRAAVNSIATVVEIEHEGELSSPAEKPPIPFGNDRRYL